jgi:thiol-disulfide isomerase/thioredoxin
MRYLTTLAAFMALGVSALAAPPVPRPAKEFDFVLPSGQHMLLSSLKGKVVIVQGLLYTCPHCQAMSQLLTKMQNEYGPRGFQAMGIAYDVDDKITQNYVNQYHVGFPVGYASSDTMLSFLSFSVIERFTVPQEVIIDRKGVIQAQSPAMSDGLLQQEANLRPWIEKLLGPAPGVSEKPPAAKSVPTSSAKPAATTKKPTS